MFSSQQIRWMQMVQMAWHHYFLVLMKRCQQLRLPTSLMGEDLFIKVEL